MNTGEVLNFFRDWNSFTPRGRRFKTEWTRFAARNSQGIQGCWQGTWVSSDRGKSWPVKCIFTRIAPGTYIATFSRRYFDLLPVSHELQLRVVEGKEKYELEGAADLGKWSGGVHHFQGIGSRHSISCQFHSPKDNGELRLSRSGEGQGI